MYSPFGKQGLNSLFSFCHFFAKGVYILFIYYALMFSMAGKPVNFTQGSYLAAKHKFLWEEKNCK